MGIERLSLDEAQEEASQMQEKITKGEATDYSEAEKMLGSEKIDKLPPNVSYEELESRIPEVAAMKGYDQRSKFHSLTLDEHTKELGRNLNQNLDTLAIDLTRENKKEQADLVLKNKNLILLAGKLHDVGKLSPEGQQINPKDPEKKQYVGHEGESEKSIREILPKHFEFSSDEQEFVAKLAGLHASALNLVNNFQTDNQPKGKALGAYDKFIAQAEGIPGDMDTELKMRIIFALNKSDKAAGYNENSDMEDDKVRRIKENADSQIKVLGEMEKALPAILKAVQARRSGDQTAGVVFVNGEYKYNKDVESEKKVEIPPELKKLGGILRDKMKPVAENFKALRQKKDDPKAMEGILFKKLGLSEEQAQAVKEIL